MTRLSVRGRGIVVLLAALLGAGLTGSLGLWQLERAGQKAAMQRALDERSRLPPLDAAALATTAEAAAAQQHRAVRLQGRWLAERTIYLENRSMDGRVGFIALTPLLLEHGAVVVQRGWAARDAVDRTRLPDLATPDAVVEVAGLVAAPPSRLFEFSGSAAAGGRIRQNLDLAEFARETGLALYPLSILQADDAGNRGDGLLRHWAPPAIDVHKHYAYAAQWFALAALISGLYVWFQLVVPRLRGTRGTL